MSGPSPKQGFEMSSKAKYCVERILPPLRINLLVYSAIVMLPSRPSTYPRFISLFCSRYQSLCADFHVAKMESLTRAWLAIVAASNVALRVQK